MKTAARLPAPALARGMWVWGTKDRLAEPVGTATLVKSCRRAGLNEVYLSVNAGILADDRLPALMEGLRDAGVRVEALMGEAAWVRPADRAAMVALIEGVAAYDAAHDGVRFSGVHLDIEPHQLPENKGHHRFLPALAEALTEASKAAARHHLTSSADLPRFALEESGPVFARAVDRLFVMLYELRDRSAESLTRASGKVVGHTYAGVGEDLAQRMVIGLRVEDYPDDLETMLGALEGAHGGGSAARYGGWAIHDEAKYRGRKRP